MGTKSIISIHFSVFFLGFVSVDLRGQSKNLMEIVGDEIVDAAALAETLRKNDWLCRHNERGRSDRDVKNNYLEKEKNQT